MIATGVVRGKPLFRPLMVMSPLKPIGTPAASRILAIELKNGTIHGTRAGLSIRAVMCVAPSLRRFVRGARQVTRKKART
jgi:hypothetical protein